MAIENIKLGDGTSRYVDDVTGNTAAVHDPNGRNVITYVATINRTTTTSTKLITVPAGFVPLELGVYSTQASNAGTTGTINLGTASTSNYFLASYDVKTASTGQGQTYPNAVLKFGAAVSTTAAYDIYGNYAETGTASTQGGGWIMQVSGYVP